MLHLALRLWIWPDIWCSLSLRSALHNGAACNNKNIRRYVTVLNDWCVSDVSVCTQPVSTQKSYCGVKQSSQPVWVMTSTSRAKIELLYCGRHEINSTWWGWTADLKRTAPINQELHSVDKSYVVVGLVYSLHSDTFVVFNEPFSTKKQSRQAETWKGVCPLLSLFQLNWIIYRGNGPDKVSYSWCVERMRENSHTFYLYWAVHVHATLWWICRVKKKHNFMNFDIPKKTNWLFTIYKKNQLVFYYILNNILLFYYIPKKSIVFYYIQKKSIGF